MRKGLRGIGVAGNPNEAAPADDRSACARQSRAGRFPAAPPRLTVTRRGGKDMVSSMTACRCRRSPQAGPRCPTPAWADTAATLHLWTQVVGKIRLARTPWLNHSWHVTLYVSRARADHRAHSRRRPAVPDRFRLHRPSCCGSAPATGICASSCLKPMCGGGFLRRRADRARRSLASPRRDQPDALRDRRRGAVRPRHRAQILRRRRGAAASGACCQRARVLARFRTGFLGKVEPGAFLLGLVRSGGDAVFRRRAPRHPGGVPHLPDAWRGGLFARGVERRLLAGLRGAVDYPAFYSYAYPAPEGFAAAKVDAGAAFFRKELGEFILPYDAVRSGARPRRAADAIFAEHLRRRRRIWRNGTAKMLECALGEPGKVQGNLRASPDSCRSFPAQAGISAGTVFVWPWVLAFAGTTGLASAFTADAIVKEPADKWARAIAPVLCGAGTP